MNVKRLTMIPALVCLSLVAFPLGANATAVPGGGLLGDVNKDGTISILDIQAAINQVLEVADATAEADVTESGAVTILDVRQIINTVLGEGGLVQEVTGRVEFGAPEKSNEDPPEARIIAISNEGLMKETYIDPENGEFSLDLRTKTGWSLALILDTEEGEPDLYIGHVDFPVADTVSVTLPVPALSRGVGLSLGVLDFNSPATVGQDVRTLVAEMSKPVDASDTTGTGLPDFVEPILERVKDADEVPDDVETGPFFDLVGQCIEPWLEELTRPDLTDRDGNGIPDFVQPLLDCIGAQLQGWLDQQGVPVPPVDANQTGRPDFVDDILDHVKGGVPDWLDSLDRPELVDSTGDGIPDFLEDHLSLLGVPSVMDSEGDGLPNFAGDFTGNGIPNIVDVDAVIPGDLDRDGIPDELDIDSNNSGIPDYAEAK